MGTDIDRVERLRHDTPGCAHVTHFNNAGAALCPQPVVDIQKEYLDVEAKIGGYEARIREDAILQKAYTAIGKLINCKPSEIALVQSATAAWTQVFYGLDFKEGDVILTSLTEYGSNFIAFLQVVKRKGVQVEIIRETEDHDICLDHLEQLITQSPQKPALIAITHIPTNSGRVYDVAAVGRIAKLHNIPYLLDACQSVGQMPVDVQKIGCDWLSATSRKYLRGPRGIGFLYASKQGMKRAEPAIIDNHGAQWDSTHGYSLVDSAARYQQYERSFVAQAGLGAAVEYALELGMPWIWQRTQTLAANLRDQLSSVEGVVVHDSGKILCGIVSFSKENVDPADAVEILQKKKINVSASFAPSTRLDFEDKKLPQGVLRASVAYYNTEEEIQTLVQTLTEVTPNFPQHTASGLLLGSLFRKRQAR